MEDIITCPRVHEGALFTHRRHNEMARNYSNEYYRVIQEFDIPTVQQEFTNTHDQFDVGKFIDFLVEQGYVEIIDFNLFDFNPYTGQIEYVVVVGCT